MSQAIGNQLFMIMDSAASWFHSITGPKISHFPLVLKPVSHKNRKSIRTTVLERLFSCPARTRNEGSWF